MVVMAERRPLYAQLPDMPAGKVLEDVKFTRVPMAEELYGVQPEGARNQPRDCETSPVCADIKPWTK